MVSQSSFAGADDMMMLLMILMLILMLIVLMLILILMLIVLMLMLIPMRKRAEEVVIHSNFADTDADAAADDVDADKADVFAPCLR